VTNNTGSKQKVRKGGGCLFNSVLLAKKTPPTFLTVFIWTSDNYQKYRYCRHKKTSMSLVL